MHTHVFILLKRPERKEFDNLLNIKEPRWAAHPELRSYTWKLIVFGCCITRYFWSHSWFCFNIMYSNLQKFKFKYPFWKYLNYSVSINFQSLKFYFRDIFLQFIVYTIFPYFNILLYDTPRSHKGGRIHIHAFWFDIYTGDILIFSRNESTFVVVNDETLPKLEVSCKLYSSIFNNCG